VIPAGPARGEATPKKVDFVDYMLDFDSLQGQAIQLDGWLITMGETFILYERSGSMNFLYADPAHLSKDEKRFLLSRCGSGCSVSVIGTPATVMFNKGITLHRIASPKIEKTTKTTVPKSTPSQAGIHKMDVPNFITDYDSLHGKAIQLRGYLISMGETLIIYERLGSMNSVFIDGSSLSREDRKYILTRCGAGCSIEIIGKPGEIMMNKGLVATKLVK